MIEQEPALSGFGKRLLRESIVSLAIVTAGLYLIGSLYLNTKYGKLGLNESELSFDFHFVLKNSIVPLAFPITLLLLFSAFCYTFSKQAWREKFPGFPPAPLHEVLALFLLVWTIKMFADFLYPVSPAKLFVYRQRDAGFFLLGALGLLVLYFRHRAAQRHGPSRLSPSTTAYASLMASSVFLLLIGIGFGQPWPLKWWETSAFGLCLAYVGYLVWQDLHNWRKRKPHAKPPKLPKAFRQILAAILPSDPEGPKKAKRMMLVAWTILAALLSAGLGGGASATRLLAGCESYQTVQFIPSPPGLESNHTYWQVLHVGGLYYLREPPLDGGNVTIVPQAAGVTVLRGWEAAPKSC